MKSTRHSATRAARAALFARTLLAISFVFFVAIPSALASVTVAAPRCENLEDPLGIDATQPRLSWMLKSSERNRKQTAWRVLVASSAANLKAGNGDLWDSGKVRRTNPSRSATPASR